MSFRNQGSLMGLKGRAVDPKKACYEVSSTSKMEIDSTQLLEKMDLLIDQKIEFILEEKLEKSMKPLQTKVAELEAENRRMKIALRFLESELKEFTKSSRNNLNAKASILDPQKRFSVENEASDLPKSDPKKLKLLEDESSEDKSKTLINDKILSDYTKLPESIDKIQIVNEERVKCIDFLQNLTRNSVDPTCQVQNKNQLYLALPSEKPSNLVPLILQHGRQGSHLPIAQSSQPSKLVNGAPTALTRSTVFSTPMSLSIPNVTSTGEIQIGSPAANDLNDSSMEDDEVEVVPPPPPKSPLAVIDLSEDEDGDKSSYDISEILPGPECHMHPLMSPVLPFVISDEKSMSPPTLKARTGRGKDGKKAVVLRMESKISGIKNLQYRVFSYFENESEPVKDRRWKQLTCIKVQSGRVCECTLTHLMEKVRYHFVVCLVQGNNRSRFSNCAPHIY